MTYIIKATAPTSYQLNSLRAFNMPIKALGNGSRVAKMAFNTEEEAKDYLRARADIYNDSDPHGRDERLAEMFGDIERTGSLQLDAVRAYIEEIEDEA